MMNLNSIRCRLGLVALFVLVVAVVLFAPARAHGQGHYWAASYGAGSHDVSWTINPTSDGGCAVGGWTTSFGAGARDFWVLKLGPDGAVQWQKTYGGRGEEAADLVFPTSDGGYAVTGYATSFGGFDVWVLKLDASGAIQWQKTYGGSKEDEAVSIQETLDGGYIVAGETQSFGAGDWDLWILKLDAAGAIQWQKTYGGPGVDKCSADPIVQTTDGGYVVTGLTESFGAGGTDVWVLKLDENGVIQWQKTYGGGGNEEAHAMRQTLDGGYVVAAFGNSFGLGQLDVWILKLDTNGAVQWQKAVGGDGTETVWSVHQTSDGGCVVTGGTESFGAGQEDLWLLKLGQDGVVQWQKTYGGRGDDVGESVRQTSDGGYWVGGATTSFGVGGLDLWVLRLDAEGSIPGCNLGVSSNASIGDTRVQAVDCRAIVSESRATVKDTQVGAANTSARVNFQCRYEPTPTPTHTATPTATCTATPTPVYRIYLPAMLKSWPRSGV